ncbi:MAG: HAMP domain-containing histidine kinase [Deltaproteobacteria bacterium]|nr:HAMP domain-containing histidine kinase [Deltaproteobacteria bacterium]
MTTEAIFPVDPTRLEQLLHVQERLLLGGYDEATLADRLCQSTALVLGASGARLAAVANDTVETRGAYGVPFTAADDAIVRSATAERRPVLGDATHETGMLTLPIEHEPAGLAMQLRPWIGGAFGLEHVGLARYAASLAAVALKHARTRREPAAGDGGPAEILASLSHDLRQPLNVMLGYTQLLIDDTYGACTAEQREVLSTIERHARELFTVLTGALDLVRLEREADRTAAEPFTAREVIEELCTGSLAHRAGHGVALTWHADPATPPFRSDRFRVRQVLQNLVDNALRHTERGAVSVTAAPHARRVRLEVADTGSGIAAADLPHVFTPFRTGSHGRTGTGLGLYIVKRFCETLGGEVRVASTLGSGTRFTVDLPTELPAR